MSTSSIGTALDLPTLFFRGDVGADRPRDWWELDLARLDVVDLALLGDVHISVKGLILECLSMSIKQFGIWELKSRILLIWKL